MICCFIVIYYLLKGKGCSIKFKKLKKEIDKGIKDNICFVVDLGII